MLFALVAAVRLAAPSDLATGDQPLQVAYIHDIVRNGAWLVQHLDSGVPASKPPLYNWLAATPIVATGSVNEFLLKWPSLVAALATLLLTYRIGAAVADRRTGAIAAALLCVSPLFVKHVYFARTDMLLTFFITLQLFAAIKRRPVLYWSAAALAWLTKGPIGVVLPIVALSSWWWWNGELRVRWREMRFVRGVVLSLIPFALWFAAAVYSSDGAVWDQLVVAETVDRFSAESSKSKENRHALYYVPHFFARMAPVAWFFVCALFAVRRGERQGEIGVAIAWVIAMFILFSIVPSKRFDRLFPLLPGVSLAAAWVLARDLHLPRSAARRTYYLVAAVAAAAGATLALLALSGRSPIPEEAVAIGGGTAIAAGAAAMIFTVRRSSRSAIAALVVTLLLANAVYQHGFPERTRVMTARGATTAQK